jgi:hypothetical protein
LSKFEEEEEAVTNLMHKRIETVEQASAQLNRRRPLCRHLTGSCAGEIATQKEAARNAGLLSLNYPECSASIPTRNLSRAFFAEANRASAERKNCA